MNCFCGCGRIVPLFPRALRQLNKEGSRIETDVGRVQALLDEGLVSPNGEAFVIDGQRLNEALAAAVHSERDPGTDLAERAGEFAERRRWIDSRIGDAVGSRGVDPRISRAEMQRGEFDPFA
jgi:hypothetical protein